MHMRRAVKELLSRSRSNAEAISVTYSLNYDFTISFRKFGVSFREQNALL